MLRSEFSSVGYYGYEERNYELWVYIITNKHRTVLYTGMTNSLSRCLTEHDQGIVARTNAFSAQYNCRHLLWYEFQPTVFDAYAREKQIKGWSRAKKEALINEMNPGWCFLEKKI